MGVMRQVTGHEPTELEVILALTLLIHLSYLIQYFQTLFAPPEILCGSGIVR